MTPPAGIDPRGPRFTASITSVLLAVALVLSLIGISTAPGDTASAWLISSTTLADRAVDPGFIALLVIAGLFLWGGPLPRHVAVGCALPSSRASAPVSSH